MQVIFVGHVEYRHVRGETTGNIVFKFTASDLEGNDLIDQDFYITILGKSTISGMLRSKWKAPQITLVT